jgi:heat shock protein HtpX
MPIYAGTSMRARTYRRGPVSGWVQSRWDSSRGWAWRGLLALALAFSFYGLVVAVFLAIVGATVYAVVAFGPGAAAVMVPLGVLFAAGRRALWASLPRRLSGPELGVAVQRTSEPALWALVDEVCSAAACETVDELFVALDGAAGVVEVRPGLARKRRLLCLPLSYLQALDEEELRVVVAHEVAHITAGDPALGRWLARVAAALRRTVVRLEELGSVLRFPFRWYARGFFRLISSRSRAQEFAADARAACLYGPGAVARALRITAWLHEAYREYWQLEVVPALDQGWRPPIAEGFGRFLGAPGVAKRISTEIDENDAGPYSTHPSLCERLFALRADADRAPSDGPTAIALCACLEQLEASLLARRGGHSARSLRTTSWEEVGQRIHLRRWETALRAWTPSNPELTFAQLPQLFDSAHTDGEPRDDLPRLVSMAACALALELARQGWSVIAVPGVPPILRKGSRSADPLNELWAAALSTHLRAQWPARCQDLGIAEAAIRAQPHAPAPTPAPARALPTAATFALDAREVGGPVSTAVVRVAWFIGTPLAVIALVAAAAVPTPGAAVFCALVGVLIAASTGALTAIRRRSLRDPCTVSLTDRDLTITHRELLRAQLSIPLSAIRLISIDPGAPGCDARFPIFDESPWALSNDPPGPRGWVWSETHRTLPHYGVHQQTPNLLIVLNAELPGPRVRRERLHGPLNDETLRGLTLRLADPSGAQHALEHAGLVRPLTFRDLAAPAPQDQARPTTPTAA